MSICISLKFTAMSLKRKKEKKNCILFYVISGDQDELRVKTSASTALPFKHMLQDLWKTFLI